MFGRRLLCAVAYAGLFVASASQASSIPDSGALIGSIKPDARLVSKLPSTLHIGDPVKIGTFTPSAPGAFYAEDGRTLIGFDIDLVKAVAAKLGLKPDLISMDFGALITSLRAGRIDLTIAQMNDKKEREKSIDFVDYIVTGMSVMVAKGNPDGIRGPSDFCGKKVAVVAGTTQDAYTQRVSADCVAAGKPAVEVTITDSDAQNQIQLRSGRIAAILNDLPSAAYASSTVDGGNAFEVVPGDVIEGGPFGIGVNKDNPQLRDVVQAALTELVEDGTYKKILESWGIAQSAIKTITINAGP